jgi:hypothetical protein
MDATQEFLEHHATTSAMKELLLQYCKDFNYEAIVASEYGKKHNIPVYAVDAPIHHTSHIPDPYHLVQTIFREDVERVFRYSEARHSQEKLFALADRITALQYGDPRTPATDSNILLYSEVDEKEISRRDDHMVENIRKFLPQVHISGAGHTHGEKTATYYPLHERLSNLITERIRLCDGDSYECGNPIFSYWEQTCNKELLLQSRDPRQMSLWQPSQWLEWLKSTNPNAYK